MLVSVTERTREIGIRMAVGARKKDILLQFLVEALVISVSGGIAGVLLGIMISLGVSYVGAWDTIVTRSSVLLAFFFSVMVGVVFGLYPARKASLMKPIEALRYE
jgi:ABC-type antimicrobial peptide transport system permease subunit